ncbi:MAG TPA: hypothetical protein VLL76_05110 [Candidatus Omnitrophota bacterium]|nr:hypothetical protein [Candidatus Omnitrophota bacterium]
MGRDSYQQTMEQRFRDLSFQIECVKARLSESSDGLRRELAGTLSLLERRRDIMREKLDALQDEPDGTWEDLKAEVEDEWDALCQDFEERVANLA